MSWQLAAFALLGAGLGAGFLWYERTRPDAKLIALVGTLAALAALGRIAFAALPNVKPTTDIVLISGYALGGAPGYVVGAVAGLTSNFFFGQGPWTPWQMAGWGLTGVLGALLARASGGRIGRRSLAAVCFVVGFAFTALQDFGDWVTYSDHTFRQLGVYVGQGLGFDLIHALGCLGFALAFGPALLRSLRRFSARLHVRWLAPGEAAVVPLTLVAVLAASGLVGHSASAAAASARRAPTATVDAASPRGSVAYLRSAQDRDGGFGGAPGQAANAMISGWTIMALAAAGEAPADVRSAPGAASAAQYLTDTAGRELGSTGDLERTILAAHAAGERPQDVGGHDLAAALAEMIRPDGSIAEQTNLTAFGILALRAAGAAVPSRMVSWLLRQQDSDGGFSFATRGSASDVDDTGAVLEALAAAEPGSNLLPQQRAPSVLLRTGPFGATIERALTFIRRQQRPDGGFPSQAGEPANAQSTAFAVQGLLAIGVSPGAMRSASGRTPLQYLRSLIGPDGAIAYAGGNHQTPVWVTAEAELALAGEALPISPPPARRSGAGAGSSRQAANHGRGGRSGTAASRRAARRAVAARRVAGLLRAVGAAAGLALGLARS